MADAGGATTTTLAVVGVLLGVGGGCWAKFGRGGGSVSLEESVGKLEPKLVEATSNTPRVPEVPEPEYWRVVLFGLATLGVYLYIAYRIYNFIFGKIPGSGGLAETGVRGGDSRWKQCRRRCKRSMTYTSDLEAIAAARCLLSGDKWAMTINTMTNLETSTVQGSRGKSKTKSTLVYRATVFGKEPGISCPKGVDESWLGRAIDDWEQTDTNRFERLAYKQGIGQLGFCRTIFFLVVNYLPFEWINILYGANMGWLYLAPVMMWFLWGKRYVSYPPIVWMVKEVIDPWQQCEFIVQFDSEQDLMKAFDCVRSQLKCGCCCPARRGSQGWLCNRWTWDRTLSIQNQELRTFGDGIMWHTDGNLAANMINQISANCKITGIVQFCKNTGDPAMQALTALTSSAGFKITDWKEDYQNRWKHLPHAAQ